MKILRILILLHFINIQIKSQNIDFKYIEDSIVGLSPNKIDSLYLTQLRIKLETFDTNSISKNIHLYYKDLGYCYYKTFQVFKDTAFLILAITFYQKALHYKSDFTSVILDISSCYSKLGNCKIANVYLEKYKILIPKEKYNKREIKSISQICKPIKRNTIFFELLGNGFFYSINYDRLFDLNKKSKLSGRIGFCYTNNFNNTMLRNLVVPFEFTWMYCLAGNKHYIETGTGFSYFQLFDYGINRIEKDILFVYRLGYRFQKPFGGFFTKIGFTPQLPIYIINPDPYTNYKIWFLSGGVAIGYSF